MKKGFTLIELLIVIVIIGILAGVVLAVMNPAAQQRKAAESVLRSNTDKVCLAMHTCAATRTDAATACAGIATQTLGVNDPSGTPTGSTYAVTANAGVISATGTLPAAAPFPACVFTCTYTIASGLATAVAPTGCLTQ